MKALEIVVTDRLKKKGMGLFVLFCLVFLNTAPALAHKVSIFAWIDGDTVHTQSKFMGGKRPEQALVEVFDGSGNLLLSGKTDSQGLYSFQTPKKSDLQIVLTAGMGHRAVWTLSKADFQETGLEPDNSRPVNDVTREKFNESPFETPPNHPYAENGLSAAEVTALIESTLDRKLKPLMDKVTALNENRVSLSDILGGIGYIIGLVGLAAYMKYHGKKGEIEK